MSRPQPGDLVEIHTSTKWKGIRGVISELRNEVAIICLDWCYSEVKADPRYFSGHGLGIRINRLTVLKPEWPMCGSSVDLSLCDLRYAAEHIRTNPALVVCSCQKNSIRVAEMDKAGVTLEPLTNIRSQMKSERYWIIPWPPKSHDDSFRALADKMNEMRRNMEAIAKNIPTTTDLRLIKAIHQPEPFGPEPIEGWEMEGWRSPDTAPKEVGSIIIGVLDEAGEELYLVRGESVYLDSDSSKFYPLDSLVKWRPALREEE